MKVILSKSAEKNYLRLDNNQKIKIRRKLEGELAEDRSIRAWPYRIIYTINKKQNRIEVSSILHRQGSYK